MRVEGTFRVTETRPVDGTADLAVGLPVGHLRMVKEFTGDVQGRSITQFSYVHDPAVGGTYVATESFDGTVAGRGGRFAFVHSATDTGDGRRSAELFLVVPGSGTDELTGITGGGAIEIDDDGTHRLVLDVELG